LDLEENYKKEIDELCRIVENLQAENKKIKRQIASEDTEANSDVKQGFDWLMEIEINFY
jgi:hypothetical protein